METPPLKIATVSPAGAVPARVRVLDLVTPSPPTPVSGVMPVMTGPSAVMAKLAAVEVPPAPSLTARLKVRAPMVDAEYIRERKKYPVVLPMPPPSGAALAFNWIRRSWPPTPSFVASTVPISTYGCPAALTKTWAPARAAVSVVVVRLPGSMPGAVAPKYTPA